MRYCCYRSGFAKLALKEISEVRGKCLTCHFFVAHSVSLSRQRCGGKRGSVSRNLYDALRMRTVTTTTLGRMDCASLASQINEFLAGELPEAEHLAALEHLASCEACELVLAETREVDDLAEHHDHVPLSDDDRSRLLSNVIDEVVE